MVRRSALLCGLAAAIMMPVAASAQTPQDRVSATEKGSLLIYSKVEVRWSGVAPYPLVQDTFIDMANDFPANVEVQMYFINGDPPLPETPGERAHPGWNWVDNKILLTGNEPTYWAASTGQPKGVSPWQVLDPGTPPGRPSLDGTTDRVLRGYIVAWAVNNVCEEIRWNHLKGDAAIVNYGLGYAWEYNAWAIQAVDSTVNNGSPTDATPGQLLMDGMEYAQPFSHLLLDFYAVNSFAYNGPRMVQIETDLTLHPVDVDLRQDNEGPVTTKAEFEIWNMDEVKFSGTTRCITCWDQTLLRFYGVPNHFYLIALGTDKGRARIDGVASDVCDFDFIIGDGPLGTHPLDIVSQDAALLGVQAKFLSFDNGTLYGAAGGNLHGSGTEPATILYDTSALPPEQNGGNDAIRNIDRVLKGHGIDLGLSR